LSLHPVIGHEAAREALAGAHAAGRLPAALLLHGARGIGKQRLALWLAQLLVCARPEREPCGACPPCRMAASLEHPDVHWYFPLPRPKGVAGDKLVDALEAARLEEIAEIRSESLRSSHSDEVRGLYLGMVKGIRERAYKRPVMAAGPIFIIGDAELLVPQEASPEAANALLKLLEEPPGKARFVLTSSEPGRLLPTIQSRTVPLHVTGLEKDVVADFLRRERDVDAETAAWAAALGQGSIGRALGFLPDGDGKGPLEVLRRRAYEVVAAATSPGAGEGYALGLGYPPAGARGLVDLFAFVEEWLRDLAAVAIGAEQATLNRDAVAALARRASDAGVVAFDVTRAFASVERARELAYGNVNPQLVVQGLVQDLRAVLVRSAGATAGA
jgi:DNA polymerase III subunit delta'